MLLLKRIGGTIIDFGILYVIAYLITKIFQVTNVITDSELFVLLCSSVISIGIPIFLFENTIGYRILRVRYKPFETKVLRFSVLLKYCILFFLYTPFLASTLTLFRTILSDYTYINLPLSFVLRLPVVFAFLNIIIFLITAGNKNLIDYFLELSFETAVRSFFKLNTLIVTYLFASLMLISTVLQHVTLQQIPIQSQLNNTFKSYKNGYFPVEIFSKYLNDDMILCNYEETNNIILLHKPSSLIFNEKHVQRQIVVLTNEKTFNDENLRRQLCLDLLFYSKIANIFAKPPLKVDQTRIIIVSGKSYFPFISVVAHYTYYSDDIDKGYELHGNYRPDSLYRFYLKTDSAYRNRYAAILLKSSLKDSLVMQRAIDSLNDKFFEQLNYDIAKIPYFTFRGVKKKGRVSINYPAGGVGLYEAVLGDQELTDAFWLKTHYVLGY